MKKFAYFVREFPKGLGYMGWGETGWGNGYVIIPKGHKFYGKHYYNIDVKVHGGLTFSGSVEGLNWKEIPKDVTEGWVVGFDTAHSGDNIRRWPKKKVIKEAVDLMNKLKMKNS